MEQGPINLFGLRPLLPSPGSHKGTRDCEAVECSKSTREGKPYCSNHIESAPYIVKILAKLEARRAEIKLLEETTSRLPRTSFLWREALLLLRTKDFTIKSFSRRLDITHKAAARLIDLLEAEGRARSTKTSRGGRTVSGTGLKDLVDGI